MWRNRGTERPGFGGICIYAGIAIVGVATLAFIAYLAWNTAPTRRGGLGPLQENSRDRDPPPLPMRHMP